MMVLVLRAIIPKGTKPLWVKGEGYPLVPGFLRHDGKSKRRERGRPGQGPREGKGRGGCREDESVQEKKKMKILRSVRRIIESLLLF
jgi:hypothetical protein